MEKYQNNGSILQFNILRKYDSLFHFSTTIKGGESEENYATFNLGLFSGDKPENVVKNREQLSEILNISSNKLYFPYQVHSDKVAVIDNEFLSKTHSEQTRLLHGIDAVITNCKNICIGVSTADCVPVLIYDPVKKVLASVHAGWRGTVARIAEKTIRQMSDIFGCKPEDCIAGIAPSISPEKFEVGNEVVDTFKQSGFNMDEISFKNTETGKAHIDLWKSNKTILEQSGIHSDNIEIAAICTYSNPDMFFSARRQTIHSGRMVTGGIIR
jgi:YfiH family protein